MSRPPRIVLIIRPVLIIHESAAQFHPLRIIDIQDGDGCAPGLCATDEDRTAPFEVPFPDLPTRIKESHHVLGHWISPAQIGPLVKVVQGSQKGG